MIYVTDNCPWRSAANLDDPTVAKQIMHVSKVVSTVAELEHKTVFMTDTLDRNEPWVRWCRNTTHNRNWMLAHLYGLIAEYEDRFKYTHHLDKSLTVLMQQYDYKRPEVTVFLNHSRFREYIPDAIEAYRIELMDIWGARYRNRPYRWSNCEFPKWWMKGKKDEGTNSEGSTSAHTRETHS